MAWIAVVPPSPRHPHERYQVCYREGTRQRSAGIFPTKRRAEAERRAIERGRTELAGAADVDLEQKARTLFGDYVATKWWPAWKDQHPTSEYGTRKKVEKRILPTFGDIPLGDLDASTIGAWKSAMLAEELSPQTVNTYLSLLGTILNAAVDDDYLARSPLVRKSGAGRTAATRNQPVPRREVWLLREQLDRLVEAIDSRYRALVLVAALTGMRWGELVALRWDDPRFDQPLDDGAVRGPGRLRIARAISDPRRTGRGVEKGPKTEAGKRVIALDQETVQAFLAHRELVGGGPYDRIFTSPGGSRGPAGTVARNNFHRVWKRALAKAELAHHRVRHEYAALLRMRFGELNAADQSEILLWIEAGPDLDDYRQRRTASGDAPPTADEVASYADHWRRDRYSFIEDYLNRDARTRYRELVGSIGAPQHADFVSWSSSWVGPESPATAEQLSKRSVDEVIDYLRRWRPDDDTGRSFGPSIEGLSRVFSEVVARRATDFAERASDFSGVDSTYVRGLFSGLESALREGVTFPWAGPLALAVAVMDYPFEPDIEVPDRDRDPGWRWCRGQIGSLLRVGLTDRPNRVPFDLRSTTWEVIRRLTEDPNPSAEHEARYGGDNMDPLTLSINTNRGTAMHAVVEYALWCRRELESLGEDVSRGFELIPEAAEVLDRHLQPEVEASLAVRAVYGRWLPWLLLLDQSWTIERLPLLFPYQDNQALAEVVWDTYISWCPPYDSVFRTLEDHYRAAIDRVPSNRKAGSFGHDSVDSKLGQHLATLYWRRVVDFEVLERYFSRADDQLAAAVLSFVGRALMSTPGELSASVAERMQDLWEWRFSETAPHPEEHVLELRAFGISFASGKLDAGWALDALKRSFHNG